MQRERSVNQRAGRRATPLRPAFALPLLLAAGLLHWDRVALRPVTPGARRHRRSGA